MTSQRKALYLLLLAVAGSAAVLSFSALRDLALTCGFNSALAPLLPVVIDAGAAAGSIVWLGRWAEDGARGYGRTLALVLLGGSVAGNALGHGLAAYGQRPAWWVVVGVSAIAPTVLGALIHLAVLVNRAEPAEEPAAAVELRAVEDESDLPDRRGHVNTADLKAVLDDLRSVSAARGRRYVRDEIREMYGIRSDRAMTVRRMLGWADGSAPVATAAEVAS
ncbi:MAG TPA: DUF2637 domain-containing protein [Nocardioides sp.]